MKVIICGAGQVGYTIASYLSGEDTDVTVIDQNPEHIARINDSFDVRTIVGQASHPDILEQAGAGDADLIIAVTHSDEVNMVACQVAHSIFDIPKKIARIRGQSYLRPEWSNLYSREHLPIDKIISPEIEVANAVLRRLSMPGTFNVIPLADGHIHLLGVICEEGCPLVNTPLRQLTGLFPDLSIEVVAIIRGRERIIPGGQDQMLVGDEVYFATDTRHIDRALSAFGHEEQEARRILIVGGGNIGLFLAHHIEANYPGIAVRIIELNSDRAEYISETCQRTTIINGDALDRSILEEANIQNTETLVAVTDDDEANILVSLLAKQAECKRTITLIKKSTYSPLIAALGIDAVVSPRAITVSSILQHIRRGRIKSVHTLRDGVAEIIDAEISDNSDLVNHRLQDVKLPKNTIFGAILREGKVIIPRPDTMFKPNDRVVLLTEHDQVHRVEELLSPGMGLF